MQNRSVQWLVVAAVLVILGAGLSGLPVNPGASAPRGPEEGPADDIVVSWNWKKDVAGGMFAVFGTVRNTGLNNYAQVVLEFRTEDAGRAVVARHPVRVTGLQAGGERPFREDIPRTGREEMGYMEVKARLP